MNINMYFFKRIPRRTNLMISDGYNCPQLNRPPTQWLVFREASLPFPASSAAEDTLAFTTPCSSNTCVFTLFQPRLQRRRMNRRQRLLQDRQRSLCLSGSSARPSSVEINMLAKNPGKIQIRCRWRDWHSSKKVQRSRWEGWHEFCQNQRMATESNTTRVNMVNMVNTTTVKTLNNLHLMLSNHPYLSCQHIHGAGK